MIQAIVATDLSKLLVLQNVKVFNLPESICSLVKGIAFLWYIVIGGMVSFSARRLPQL